MRIRDRIKELRRVKASELRANPKNWRTHPIAQRDALEGVLNSIGYADALIARETSEGLELIDGHLRAETTPDAEVPVLVLDLNEQEADLLLATLDPLGALAGRDELKLKNLLDSIGESEAGLSDLLDSLRGQSPDIPDSDDWNDEGEGMPELEQEDLTPYRSLNIHFRNEEDISAFAELVAQEITDKTKSIWHPISEPRPYAGDAYIDEDSTADLS